MESGLAPDDDAVQRALAYLRDLKPQTTYAASLTTMVLCAAEPQRDQKLIKRYATWLADGQKQAGPLAGAWGYPQAEGDNSNSGFALMALYEADRAGVQVGKDVWRRALNYWAFGDHDWFAEGAKSLISQQTVPDGYWQGAGPAESNPRVATSLALLFLTHENDLAP